MNILNLEEQRQQFISKLNSEKCIVTRLLLFNSFFDKILSTNDEIIIETFLSEFEWQYILDLLNFNPTGLEPDITESIVTISKNILNNGVYNKSNEKLRTAISKISSVQKEIEKSLMGKPTQRIQNISFPVNINSNISKSVVGQIENISIKIHSDKTLIKDNFIIIPTIQQIDPQLKEQIQTSWYLAIKYLESKFKKISSKHEVIIILGHKYAYYEGYSLGLALTLGFIQELFKFYNTQLLLAVNENTIFTGGMNKLGHCESVGNAIKTKVKTIFFSTMNLFAIPGKDYKAAKKDLELLLIKYPQRKLKLIRIEDFDDLINHRNLVVISKASIFRRTKKYVKKNSLVLFLSSLLILILSLIFVYTNDYNPVEFEQVGNILNILNSHGEVLWETKVAQSIKYQEDNSRYFYKICDINNDGINEVILSYELLNDRDMDNMGRIACFDNKKKLLWKYKFRDQVSTKSEIYKDEYASRLVDLVNIDGVKTLICIARHLYFPSAIYKLDIRTGKRLKGTLWSQGHFMGGQIGDFNEDDKPEIFISGINNGSESAFALISDLENLKGQTPTVKNYLFMNMPIGKFTKYFLFEKTDLCRLFKNRFNRAGGGYFAADTRTYKIKIDERYPYKDIGPVYVFNNTLDSAWLQIGDGWQFIRDSLIIKGKLSPPYTNDKLYDELLISGIKEWDGNKFVPFKKKQLSTY